MKPMFRLSVQDPKPMRTYVSASNELTERCHHKTIIVEETEYTHILRNKIFRLQHEFYAKHFVKDAKLIVSVKDYLHLVIIHNMMKGYCYAPYPDVEMITHFEGMELVVVPQGEPQIVPSKWQDMLWDNVETDSSCRLKD